MARSRLLIAVTFVALILVPNTWARSGKEYKFRGGTDGAQPQGGLVSDGAGNFYGTTIAGGRFGFGTVFILSQGQGGSWTRAVIYSFKGEADGQQPQGNLTIDAVGSVYGTATGGAKGWGTVFELTPGQNGGWIETNIYNFQNGVDGVDPTSGVIFDAEGNLYGTTSNGGCNSSCSGTVFKLTPSQAGEWTESTLYSFPGGSDGAYPNGVVLDSAGNLFGTTTKGGNPGGGACFDQGCGTVFELTQSQGGNWTETILYRFNDSLDGELPTAGVTLDSAGNLYGEASEGGSLACPGFGCGVVFVLTPEPDEWKFSVVHTFNGFNGSKGTGPTGGMVFDSEGNLYGTTAFGGGGTGCGGYGCGTIFKLSPNGGGVFAFKMIGVFNGTDGQYPYAGVVVDAAGSLYGTTLQGGNPACAPFGCGVVFTIAP
jgi:uncharacterized repeat protein (TIGR03803 family)